MEPTGAAKILSGLSTFFHIHTLLWKIALNLLAFQLSYLNHVFFPSLLCGTAIQNSLVLGRFHLLNKRFHLLKAWGTVVGRGPILQICDYLPHIQLKGCHSPMKGTRAWICSKTWRQETHHCRALHCEAHARVAGPSFPFGWLMRLFSWDRINTAKLLSTALELAVLLGNCFFPQLSFETDCFHSQNIMSGFWSLKMDEDVCCSQQEPCCMPTKRKENKSLHCCQNQLW